MSSPNFEPATLNRLPGEPLNPPLRLLERPAPRPHEPSGAVHAAPRTQPGATRQAWLERLAKVWKN